MNRKSPDWQRFATPLGFVRLVLLADWDPIGIFGYPGAMDEYDSYAVEVYDLLCADTPRHILAEHLRQIERERMGTRGKADLDVVAAKLRRVYETSRGNQEE